MPFSNVYGLCWSKSLLARMECAALFSPLVIQSLETSSGYGFRERRVRPLCHLLIRQQTWQETLHSLCGHRESYSIAKQKARNPKAPRFSIRVSERPKKRLRWETSPLLLSEIVSPH